MSSKSPEVADFFSGRSWTLGPIAISYIQAACRLDFWGAAVKLKEAMLDGEVRSRGPISSDLMEAIPSEFWQYSCPDENGAAASIRDEARVPWFDVNVADVLARWPLPTSVAPNLLQPPLQSSRTVGRPSKYDWPMIDAWLAHYLYEHGCPAAGEQAELERQVIGRFPADSAPSESQIRERVAAAISVRRTADG